MNFVYLKIPMPPKAGRHEREVHAALDQALDQALAQAGLGSLLGWGPSLARDAVSGGLEPAFHRVDIEVTDLSPALALLRAELLRLQAPAHTELHYTVDGEALQQELEPQGWSASHPTTAATARRHHGGSAAR
ncbi:hypothetical protein LXT12_22045 [Pelomonas sp. P7]|uniref:Uncharacterized protein n=1 Tax=Pelomonas caseinilytica TaxID=2906763 RepID=A0ABS8XLY8_9BURK|nr:hypothetical protein [Pelomonas sp. P7]MCE4539937.1 hypothetical protein [Pelomonas sp. P7]